MNVSEATHTEILLVAREERVHVAFVERGRVELVAPLPMLYGGRLITIPAGFNSDGASVPAFFWPIVSHPFSGSSLKAALAHDYFCQMRTVDSRAVHRWFYDRLRMDGCARVRSVLMYAAVRWFGPRFRATSHTMVEHA